MKTLHAFLVPALATFGLAAVPAFPQAQNPLARPDAGQARQLGTQSATPRHYGGVSRGGDRWRDGDRWRGHRRPWRGHSHWSWGLSFGFPLFWGWPYYGYGGYYGPWFYPDTYVYREIEVVPEYVEPAPETTEVAPEAKGAPRQGPLYMNYCESAKAYFPSVTSCPEGWKATVPTR